MWLYVSSSVVALGLALAVKRATASREEISPIQPYGSHTKSVSFAKECSSMGELFLKRCKHRPSAPAFYIKVNGQFQGTTWGQWYDSSSRIANYLVNDLKLSRGSRIAVLGSTQPKWNFCDMAAQLAGLVTVGIYTHQVAEQYRYIIEHSEAAVVFVYGEELATLIQACKGLECVRVIVTWEDHDAKASEGADSRIVPWSNVVKAPLADSVLRERITLETENEICTFVYTSGTTGPPKAVMLSHRNVLAFLKIAEYLYPMMYEDSSTFAFLPMAHVGEKIIGCYSRINRGIVTTFASSIPQLFTEVAQAKPTWFGSVPRMFEKAYAKIFADVSKKAGFARFLFAWAVRVGRYRTRLVLAGKPVPLFTQLQYFFAFKLFAKVRAAFGGRVNHSIVGAAPIDKAILEFFWSAGIPIYEMYGLTEATAATHTNYPGNIKMGSVGKPLPGVEQKLAEDGEIMVRSPTVFEGYYKSEEATRQTIVDGWLLTGDIGTIDEDGYLWITDRKKHLIITAGGKNLPTVNIQNSIKVQDPLISMVHAHGDKRPFVSALIAPSPLETLEWGVSNGIVEPETFKILAQQLATNPSSRSQELNTETAKVVVHPDYVARLKDAVVRGNQMLSQVEKVKLFMILDRDFSQEQGELTPTMKLRRREVEVKFHAMFDRLYSDSTFGIQVYSTHTAE